MFRRGLFYSYLTIYLRHYLGMSVTATTLFATLPMVVNILAQTFIWGRISDRFQIRRSMIMAGEILAALGTIGVWWLHHQPLPPIMAGYIIIIGLTGVELFWSMSNISWSALISDLYGQQDRGTIQGRLASMGGVGRMIGVWAGGLFYDGLGLQYAGWGFSEGLLFFLAAGVMTVSVLPLFLLPEGGVQSSPDESRPPRFLFQGGNSSVLKFFIFFLIGLALINFGRNSIGIIFPQYLSATTGPAVGSRTLSLILNTQSLAIIAFGWIVGWACRHWGAGPTLLTGSASAIAAMFILSTSTSLSWIYLGTFLRGVADATVMAAGYEIASILIPPARRARYFAWFNATFFLSWGLPATLITGPIVDWWIAGGRSEGMAYQFAFTVAGIITTMGFAIVVLLMIILKPELFGRQVARR